MSQQNPLDKNVYVYADEPVTARWDGKDYQLGATPVEVKRGIAEHWQGVHAGIRIEDVPAEVIGQRKPENPLEKNNRGLAFAGLKNGGLSKEEVAAIRAKGKELGISGAHNMKIDKLQAELAEAEKQKGDEQLDGDRSADQEEQPEDQDDEQENADEGDA